MPRTQQKITDALLTPLQYALLTAVRYASKSAETLKSDLRMSTPSFSQLTTRAVSSGWINRISESKPAKTVTGANRSVPTASYSITNAGRRALDITCKFYADPPKSLRWYSDETQHLPSAKGKSK